MRTKFFTLIILLTFVITAHAQEDEIVMNSEIYSFEKGNWWIKSKNAWSFSTDKKVSGEKSLKFHIDDFSGVSAPLQTHGPGKEIDQLIKIKAGTYYLKAKIWLGETVPPTIQISIKDGSGFINTSFKLDRLQRGEWIEVTSKKINVENDMNAKLIISVSDNKKYGGEGSFYIDDLVIEK